METDKPLISILMAVYEPRMDWLEEQLLSLNGQTYPNLRLYVQDDCSPAVAFWEIEGLVKRCITAFPCTIARNEENLGSNGTFQRLTEEAEGVYFAYCDQDDVWQPEKLAVLQNEIEKSGALLACSDMYIIDGSGEQVANSITKVRRHHHFHSGAGLAEGLLVSNFVTGCTMLVRSECAKATVPFCPHMVHDHYIALCCAAVGELISIDRPLIRYRIHGGNQTGLMAGVKDKSSYGTIRIMEMVRRLEWLDANSPCGEALRKELSNALRWAKAREDNWQHRGGKKTVWKYRRFSPITSVLEVFAAGSPELVFQAFLRVAKRNWI